MLFRSDSVARRAAVTTARGTVTGMLALLPRLSRIAADPTHEDAFDLDQAITDVVGVMRGTIDPETVMTLELAPIPLVRGVAPEVKLALMGLVDNALQAVDARTHAHDHPGRVTISTRVEGGLAVVAIFDTGEAVSDATRARIFQPWFVPQDGERCGMAYASRIVVEKTGGFLTIDNAQDGGVTVFVKFPLVSPPRVDLAPAS